MLKYINYQLLDDEEEQQKLEKAIAPTIRKNIRQNVDAFRVHIPSLLGVIQRHTVQQYSLFCTKEQQLNIVDFASGRVFYGSNPMQEVEEELSTYYQCATFFKIRASEQTDQFYFKKLPSKIDVMVVFGLGLGMHLLELVNNCTIKYLIVYEPSEDIFICSLQASSWDSFLETCASKGTHIFLQIGDEANNFPSELDELLQITPDTNEIFIYRHQFHPVMDSVVKYLLEFSGCPDKILLKTKVFTPFDNFRDYVSERAANVIGLPVIASVSEDSIRIFNENLTALAQYYPAIYKEMLEHTPKSWEYINDALGQPNIYHKGRLALFHKSTDDEYETLYEHFLTHPFRDDIILGVRSGGKLWRYTHFKYMRASNELLSDTLKKRTRLPEKINSLIVFGVALGKHIDLLTKNHEINNLMICEPNADFFYASLSVTNWAEIFKRADESGKRIYLNLGGNGSHYFQDLMSQFYQIGAYSVADTYMLSTYYNVSMQKSIGDLRSELRVVLALGEYFDHAYYGISHTYHGIENGCRFLHQNVTKHNAFELPVFVIGNGPSLDKSIDYIKEFRDKVIVVSCGTALRSLYVNGIQPDFHAEIEQNRATYDWITQINDHEYLKKIYLLSVNGIHPDTASLFSDVLLCFKEGEASTFVFNNGLKKQGFEISTLSYAYPTVTNLVLNYLLKWGFKYFYLHGVDLGYHDVNNHHSKFSAYYRPDGTEIYDYQEQHGGGVVAQGNLVPYVFTKPEFEVSRKLLEEAIKNARSTIEIYNCSDGVRIAGATPLQLENILLSESNLKEKNLLTSLINDSFYPSLKGEGKSILNNFKIELYKESLECWESLLAEDVTEQDAATELIAKQWDFIRSRAARSDDMTFCLYHGSANYYAGILAKLASNIGDDTPQVLDTFNKVLQVWRDYLSETKQLYLENPLALDTTSVQVMFE